MLVLQITIFGIMLVGLIVRKAGIVGPQARRDLTSLVINIVLPCNIITSFITRLSADLIRECVTILLISVFLSFVYPVMIAVFGTLYLPETAVGYLGFILLGFAFLALDMLIASMTRTPMVAVIASFGVHLLLWLADLFAQAVSVPVFSPVLSFLSLFKRISPFLNGRLSFANLLFDLSFCAAMLFLCVRVLDSRRWRDSV